VSSAPALIAGGEPPALLATRVGVHRLDGERLAVANLFDDAESDVGRRGGGDWSPPDAAASASAAGHAITWWCLLAALAAVVGEWLVWARRGESA
jgi:hypothetical protein